MHSYVLVVNSPYSKETDGGIHAHYGKEDIYLGLPGKCDYADEMDVNEIDLDELENGDIFGELSPRITRSLGRIDVQLGVQDVCEHLLDCIDGSSFLLQELKKEIQARAHDSLSLFYATSALCDPFDLRIQDGNIQYDATSWLYHKLVEANRNADDSIVFEIVQAFHYDYSKGEENA